MNGAATILVVEDEQVVAEDIRQALNDLGYATPRTAATAAEAFQRAARFKPHLILMDIKLKGGTDGIAAGSEIRRRLGIPVVYITSLSDDATLARAAETGPYGFLVKPFDEGELRAVLEVALKRRECEVALQARERRFATTLDSIAEAVIATDSRGIVTFMNAVALRATGWLGDEAIWQDVTEVVRLTDSDGSTVENPVSVALREARACQAPHSTTLLPKTGQTLLVDPSASPIVDGEGRVAGGVMVLRDVTARVQLEQGLAQRERRAALGAMALEMGQEFNDPLMHLVGNVGFSLRGLREVIGSLGGLRVTAEDGARFGNALVRLEEVGKALLAADDAVDQMHSTVLGLKEFTPPDAHDSKPSTIRLTFPPASPTVSPFRASGQPSKPPRRGRVLLVDEEAIASEIARMLRSEHEVTVETDARTALARIARGERYDAIFCDLSAPTISGIDVYRTLLSHAPELAARLVFMTSRDFSAQARPFLDKVPNVSLDKPVSLDLVRTIIWDFVASN